MEASNTILRIENRENCLGMYSNIPSIFSCSTYTNNDRHPEPKDDSLLTENFKKIGISTSIAQFRNKFIFGFTDIAQLKNWLYRNDWIEFLHKNDYVLREYSGEVIFGNTQACIRQNTAKLIREISLLEII